MALDFKTFSEANKTRCEANDGFKHKIDSWSHAEWLSAAAGELGEVAHLVKAILRKRDGLTNIAEDLKDLEQQLGEEIADTVIYLDLLAQRAGVDLGDAISRKFNKTSKKIGSNVNI